MMPPDQGQEECRRTLRTQLLASGALQADELRELRGDLGLRSTLSWVQEQDGGVLVVEDKSRSVFPAFQFNSAGAVRPELVQHIRTLQHARLGSWQMWAWLTSPATLLSGDVPVDVLVSNPERAALAVRRLADRVRA